MPPDWKPLRRKTEMRQYTAADFRGFYYAHRGLYDNHHGIPENSIAAFRAAAEKGYGVELDVQLSSDGHVVVFHDDTLDRICGVHGKVIDYPLEQLQEKILASFRREKSAGGEECRLPADG